MDDGGKPEQREQVTIVYCGGCNPHIDRAAVAGRLSLDDPDVRPGATVHLSGCPRACASGHRLVIDDPADVVVAGEFVDAVPTPQSELACTVMNKLKELVHGLEG